MRGDNGPLRLDKVFFADAETHEILPRPQYPPKPVGLALEVRGTKTYYAWGHPTQNNATVTQARRHYLSLLEDGWIPCFHNAGFDLDVLEVHLDLPWVRDHHDTLILAFLDDPRRSSFSLKPLAQEVLDEPPTERDRLRDWILANVPEAKRKPKQWGAHISKAPGKLVEPYAKGDVARTSKLFRRWVRSIWGCNNQRPAYQREIALTRVIIRMERRGIPVATRRLGLDIPRYQEVLRGIEQGLFRRLRVPKREQDEFKWSGESFADALERAGVVDEWVMTEKDNRSTSVDSLREVGVDEKLVSELEVRAQIATCLNTFMTPWYEQGKQYDNRFYARFNQVRQDYHAGNKIIGTETGRLSMTPNVQNAIRSDKDDRVPKLRSYIVPGRVLPIQLRCKPVGLPTKTPICIIQRDYSQQELRLLADKEDGPFLAKYLADPTIDAHVAVLQLIQELTGLLTGGDAKKARRTTKDLNFGLIYGMGLAKLALKLGIPLSEARVLLKAHMKSLPGVKRLKDELKKLEDTNEPFFTLGGRRYVCEEPKLIKGRMRKFGYKTLNTYVQGSAADVTKEAMIQYYEQGFDDNWPLILQVHDELLTLAPWSARKRAHIALNKAMLDAGRLLGCKVPMLSDGKVSKLSWHRMQKVAW